MQQDYSRISHHVPSDFRQTENTFSASPALNIKNASLYFIFPVASGAALGGSAGYICHPRGPDSAVAPNIVGVRRSKINPISNAGDCATLRAVDGVKNDDVGTGNVEER
ncbi:hypothetical protein Bbelb_169820 [Branchiostoma belcheri]|nr:hypothetical protein Bbelb_169820 [Branchiostoma belcheri]